MEEEKVHCPKCNSDQITSDKKGFSWGKAFIGALLTGGIGLIFGFLGSKKLVNYCVACGHMFRPGAGPYDWNNTASAAVVYTVLLVGSLLFIFWTMRL